MAEGFSGEVKLNTKLTIDNVLKDIERLKTEIDKISGEYNVTFKVDKSEIERASKEASLVSSQTTSIPTQTQNISAIDTVPIISNLQQVSTEIDNVISSVNKMSQSLGQNQFGNIDTEISRTSQSLNDLTNNVSNFKNSLIETGQSVPTSLNNIIRAIESNKSSLAELNNELQSIKSRSIISGDNIDPAITERIQEISSKINDITNNISTLENKRIQIVTDITGITGLKDELDKANLELDKLEQKLSTLGATGADTTQLSNQLQNAKSNVTELENQLRNLETIARTEISPNINTANATANLEQLRTQISELRTGIQSPIPDMTAIANNNTQSISAMSDAMRMAHLSTRQIGFSFGMMISNGASFRQMVTGISGLLFMMGSSMSNANLKSRLLAQGLNESQIKAQLAAQGYSNAQIKTILMGKGFDIARIKATLMWAAISLGVSLAISAITKVIDKLKQLNEEALSGIKDIGLLFLNIGKSAIIGLGKIPSLIKGITSGLLSLANSLYNIAKSTIVFQSTKGALDDVMSAMREMVTSGVSFNGTLDTIRNNLLSAFMPALQALYPVIMGFMQLIAELASILAMFMSMLFGSAKFTGKLTKGLGGAGKAGGKAAKELKAALLPIDELNKLGEKPSGGGGGGGGIGGLIPDFAPWDKFAKDLRKFFTEADFYKWFTVGAKGAAFFTKALRLIPWDTIRFGARNVGENLAGLLSGFLTNRPMWVEVGRFFAEILNTIGDFLGTFATKFQWAETGKAIATGINSFFSSFDVGVAVKSINAWSLGLLNLIISAIEDINWDLVGIKIGNLISGINWKSILGRAGTGIINLATGISTLLSNALSNIDFKEIGSAFATGLNNVFDIRKMGNIGTTLGKLAKGILDLFIGFIRDFDWANAGKSLTEAIRNFFAQVSPYDIADTINNLVQGLLTFFNNADFSQIKDFAVNIIKNIDWKAMLNLIGKLKELKDIPKTIVNAISSEIKPIIFKQFTDKVINGILSFIDNMPQKAADIGNKISSIIAKIIVYGIPLIAKTAIKLGEALIIGLVEGIVMFIPNLIKELSNLGKLLEEKVGLPWAIAITTIVSVVTVALISTLIPVFITFIGFLFGTVIPAIIEFGISLITALGPIGLVIAAVGLLIAGITALAIALSNNNEVSAYVIETEKNYETALQNSKTALENVKLAEDNVVATKQNLINVQNELNSANDTYENALKRLEDANIRYNQALANSSMGYDELIQYMKNNNLSILDLESNERELMLAYAEKTSSMETVNNATAELTSKSNEMVYATEKEQAAMNNLGDTVMDAVDAKLKLNKATIDSQIATMNANDALSLLNDWYNRGMISGQQFYESATKYAEAHGKSVDNIFNNKIPESIKNGMNSANYETYVRTQFEKVGKAQLDGTKLGLGDGNVVGTEWFNQVINGSMQKMGISGGSSTVSKGWGENTRTGFEKGLGSGYDIGAKFASDVNRGFKDKADIHSPSRVFMYFGDMCVAGLKNSFEDGIPKIVDTFDGITEGISDIQDDVSLNGFEILFINIVDIFKNLGNIISDIIINSFRQSINEINSYVDDIKSISNSISSITNSRISIPTIPNITGTGILSNSAIRAISDVNNPNVYFKNQDNSSLIRDLIDEIRINNSYQRTIDEKLGFIKSKEFSVSAREITNAVSGELGIRSVMTK